MPEDRYYLRTPPIVPITIQRWLGLNSRDSDLTVKLGESPDLSNIEFFQDGWVTRSGITKKNSSPFGSVAVQGIFDGYNDILLYEGTNLRKWNSSTGAFDTLTGATGLVDGAVPQFVSFNALDIMVNGPTNDTVKKWDGTNFGALNGSPPKGSTIAVFQGRIFIGGLATPNFDEVQYSDLEDPETWQDRFLRPSKRQKGHDVVCVAHMPVPNSDGRLVIMCSDAIFHFGGFTDTLFRIESTQPKLGIISPRSLIIAEGLSFWVDENGIYCSPDAGVTVNPISWNIQDKFDDLNKSRLSLSAAVHFRYKRQVWFTFSNGSSSSHNIVFIYNYGLSTPMTPPWHPNAQHVWSIYEGLNLMSLAEVLQSNEYQVWGGDSGNRGFAYQLDKGTDDDGTAISWSLKTARFALTGSWSIHAILRKLVVIHQSLPGSTLKVDMMKDFTRSITVSQSVDTGAEGGIFGIGVFGTATWGESSAIGTDVWFNDDLVAVQFEFSGNDKGKLFKCFEIAIESIIKGVPR